MATPTTIKDHRRISAEETGTHVAHIIAHPMRLIALTRFRARERGAASSRLPGWIWFVLLWGGGVAAAVSLGFVFRIFMNATLFAVTR